MDERVLRWVTILSGVLTVVTLMGLYYFPDIRLQPVLAEKEHSLEDAGINTPEKVFTAAPEKVVEQEEDLKSQLKIGLPDDVLESQLKITNDYLTQTLFIRFANGVPDYFKEYGIKGKSDHIASFSYYQDGDEGVIALQLDRVYECDHSFEQGNLYLDFVDPHDIYEKVVVIDAGHGSRAPGAVKKGVAEKDIDLAILLELKEILSDSEENIGVYYTRVSDTNPTLDQRVQLANKSQADLFISIHNNSSASGNFTRTNGTEVLYSESDTSEFSSKRFAQICLDNVVGKLHSKNMGLVKGDDIYIIRTSKVPVALIEVGFMTNIEELEKLLEPKYQRKAAKGIYQAILQAFQEGY